MSLPQLDADARAALVEVAAALGIPVAWLAQLVHFETAGTWSPTIKNPHSSARGLLQFLNATARGLGYLDSADLVAKHPTVASQLRGPVLAYLSRWAPYKSDAALAMAVFYPAARSWPEDREFPQDVQDVNPGIRTVGDYVARMRSRAGALAPMLAQLATRAADVARQAGPPVGAALLLAVLVFALASGGGGSRT